MTPWTAARQASQSFTVSQSLLKLISIESVMPSNHLILCHPLLLLFSIFPSLRVFSNESALLCLFIWWRSGVCTNRNDRLFSSYYIQIKQIKESKKPNHAHSPSLQLGVWQLWTFVGAVTWLNYFKNQEKRGKYINCRTLPPKNCHLGLGISWLNWRPQIAVR